MLDLLYANWKYIVGGIAAVLLLATCWRAILWLFFGVIIGPDYGKMGAVTKKWLLSLATAVFPRAASSRCTARRATRPTRSHRDCIGRCGPGSIAPVLWPSASFWPSGVGLLFLCDGAALYERPHHRAASGVRHVPGCTRVPRRRRRARPADGRDSTGFLSRQPAAFFREARGCDQHSSRKHRRGRGARRQAAFEGGWTIARRVECDSSRRRRSGLHRARWRTGPADGPCGARHVSHQHEPLRHQSWRSVIDIPENKVGNVTTRQGKALRGRRDCRGLSCEPQHVPESRRIRRQKGRRLQGSSSIGTARGALLHQPGASRPSRSRIQIDVPTSTWVSSSPTWAAKARTSRAIRSNTATS